MREDHGRALFHTPSGDVIWGTRDGRVLYMTSDYHQDYAALLLDDQLDVRVINPPALSVVLPPKRHWPRSIFAPPDPVAIIPPNRTIKLYLQSVLSWVFLGAFFHDYDDTDVRIWFVVRDSLRQVPDWSITPKMIVVDSTPPADQGARDAPLVTPIMSDLPTELAQLDVDRIARVFGVPPHLVDGRFRDPHYTQRSRAAYERGRRYSPTDFHAYVSPASPRARHRRHRPT